jgi:4-diphosphocytidyl-2-C-methyl-D-erythritol kinase
MGAGLGGGSADAAHVIRMLSDIFGLNLTQQVMMELAASIGSDTAFFIQDEPMLGTGRGEILSSVHVNLIKKYIVLVNPAIHVSTPDAYSLVKPRKPDVSLTNILALPLIEWRNSLKNDFEVSVFEKFRAFAK